MSTSSIPIIAGGPVLSALIIIFTAIIMLYIARRPAHEIILSISRLIHRSMRLSSRSVMHMALKLTERNREVLLAAGEESVERIVEREFHRVATVVERDLSGYPTLQQTITTEIAKIEEDYAKSADAPPAPPEWAGAADAVSNINVNDTLVADMVGALNKNVDKQYKKIIEDYRKASSERHALLKKMLPFWRKVSETLGEVDKTISGILERAKVIDSKMDFFEEIRKGTDRAVRTLSSSSLTQFFIAGLVTLIALAGAVINFNLIALPMSEMVGGGSYLGPFKTSEVAAAVIILIEIAMGLFLLESLRITKLFPIIGAMDDKMRHKMMYVSFTILFILASIEASLAYMRDMIAADMAALRQSLADVTVAPEQSANWIPTVGQMVMGFILPFALAFIAIPLESFIHSARTVLGLVVVGILRGFAFLLRFIGNVSKSVGEIFVKLYDLLVFAPLWIEDLVKNGTGAKLEKKNMKNLKEGNRA